MPDEEHALRITRQPPPILNALSLITSQPSRFTLPGLSIMDVCALSVQRADEFFATLNNSCGNSERTIGGINKT